MTIADHAPRDESEMLARARVEAERAFAARTAPSRGVVWWAALITVIAIGTIAFAFVYSYVYLRLGADRWPLDGTELRTWQLPGLAIGLVAAGLAIGPGSGRGRPAMAAAAVLATGGLVAQLVALVDSGYAVDANAYEALVVTMEMIAAVVLACALGVRVAAVRYGWPRRGPDALHDADTVFFVGFGTVWIALWIVVHLAPRVL